MKKSDAEKMLCPFKLSMSNAHKEEKLCETVSCMGWVEWRDEIYKKDERYKIPMNSLGTKSKDPEQGHCYFGSNG